MGGAWTPTRTVIRCTGGLRPWLGALLGALPIGSRSLPTDDRLRHVAEMMAESERNQRCATWQGAPGDQQERLRSHVRRLPRRDGRRTRTQFCDSVGVIDADENFTSEMLAWPDPGPETLEQPPVRPSCFDWVGQ